MQVTFLNFWTAILSAVAEFLLTEPVIYFTGILVLIFVTGLIFKLIR